MVQTVKKVLGPDLSSERRFTGFERLKQFWAQTFPLKIQSVKMVQLERLFPFAESEVVGRTNEDRTRSTLGGGTIIYIYIYVCVYTNICIYGRDSYIYR